MTRHAFDPLSLLFGAVFAVVAAAALTGPWDLRAVDLAWVGPALLVLLGLVVLLTARAPARLLRDDGDGREQGGPMTADARGASGDPTDAPDPSDPPGGHATAPGGPSDDDGPAGGGAASTR